MPESNSFISLGSCDCDFKYLNSKHGVNVLSAEVTVILEWILANPFDVVSETN